MIRKVEMDRDKIERANACFGGGFSCSQAVFSAYAQDLGLDRETALRISGAFGGGMAGMADTCGAVTGAFMVIGLKYGKTKLDDDEAKKRTYSLVGEFVERFKARHSSIVCRQLLGCDIGTPEGKQTFEANKLKDVKCRKFVQDAAEILEEIL
jgi:C_GCAxxG_C_C family probable redox protein